MTSPRRRRRRPIAPQQFPQSFYPPVPYVPPAPLIPSATYSAGVQTLSAKNATVAKVHVTRTTDWNKGPDYSFDAADSAKREQGDRYDPEAGELLAMGRAFQRVGRDMIREGNKRVTAMTEELAEAKQRSSERRMRAMKPVKHRTREEWERIQRQRQHARNAELARGLGLEVTEDRSESMGFHHSSVAEWGTPTPVTARPEGARIELTNGRHITIEDDTVILRSETGAIIMGFQRS